MSRYTRRACLLICACGAIACTMNACAVQKVPPAHYEPGRFWEPLRASCTVSAVSVICPKKEFKKAMIAGAEAVAAGRKCCTERDAERGRCGVREAVCKGQLWDKDQEIKRLRWMRWVWGAVGAAIGAAGIGIGIAVAR